MTKIANIAERTEYDRLVKFIEEAHDIEHPGQNITPIVDYGNAVIAVNKYEQEHNISPTTSAKLFHKAFPQKTSFFGRIRQKLLAA